MRPLSLAIVVCALVAPASAADVLVVGPGGFSTLSQAVVAAADGDIIVVKPLLYLDFTIIDGKSLTITGEGVVDITSFTLGPFMPAITIRNLAADQSVVIRNINARQNTDDPTPVILAEDCAGTILIEDCGLSVTGGLGSGLLADSCDSVTVHRGTVAGGAGKFAAAGLRVVDSTVFVHDATLRGSIGFDAVDQIFFPDDPPGDGGPGLWITGNSSVYLDGVTILGGNGGDGGGGGLCFPGGDAGDGLRIGGGLVRERDSTWTKGTAGPGGCGAAGGAPGDDLDQTGGTLTGLAGTARRFDQSRAVVSGNDLTITYNGLPGDLVAYIWAPTLMPGFYLGGAQTVLHMDIPFLNVTLTTLPGSGELSIDIPVPALPGGEAWIPFPAQGLFLEPGSAFLSGPSSTALLSVAP